MSVPVERSVNGWTIGTLKVLIEAELAALREQNTASAAAADRAISKAEVATEKRFDAVNEFRAALSDQTVKLLTRTEYDANHKALESKVDLNFNVTQTRLATIQSRLDTWDGKVKGVGEGWGVIVAAGGLVVGVALAIAGFLSH